MPDKEPEIFQTLAGRKKETAHMEQDQKPQKRDIFTPDARNVLEVLGFIALIVIGTERAIAWAKSSNPSPLTPAYASVTPLQLEEEKGKSALAHQMLDARILSIEEAHKRIENKLDNLTVTVNDTAKDVAVIKTRLPRR